MFLAMRDLRFARGRFALMGAVVSLIAVLGVLLTGLSAGLSGGGISGIAALPAERFAFSATAAGDLFARSVVTGSTWSRAAAMPGVTAAAPFGSLTTAATVTARGTATVRGVSTDIQLFGIQPGSFITPAPRSGGRLGSTADGVLISPATAAQGVAIGDRLALGPTGVPATVIGETADASYSHIGVVYAPLALWQQVHYGLPGPLPPAAREQASVVALNLAPGTDPAALDRELGTRTLTKSAAYAAVPGYSAETGTMTLIRVFLYLISALVVGAFFTVWTVQRRREIALLKAIGASTGYVLRDALAQVIAILLAATTAGTLAGSLAGGLLTRVGAPFALALRPVALSAGLLTALGVSGAVIAIRRVTSVDPLTALGADR
jgi:putative ABC transport system permease protein